LQSGVFGLVVVAQKLFSCKHSKYSGSYHDLHIDRFKTSHFNGRCEIWSEDLTISRQNVFDWPSFTLFQKEGVILGPAQPTRNSKIKKLLVTSYSN